MVAGPMEERSCTRIHDILPAGPRLPAISPARQHAHSVSYGHGLQLGVRIELAQD